jgi:hypothetical protein
MAVRQYRDSSYRYVVGAVDAADDDRDGIYGEEQLTGTGKRADLVDIFPPARFTVRDVVAVSPSHPDVEVAGKEGEVLSWSVDARYLSATGRRLPVPDRNRLVTSSQVGTDGSLLGTTNFFVIEHVEDLL